MNKEEIKKNWILYLLLAGLFILFLWDRLNRKDPIYSNQHTTDTVYVREVKTIEIKSEDQSKPVVINIQQKPDPRYREKKESETIVIGAKVEKDKVTVQKIDTAGVKTEEIHKIEKGSKVSIDSNGNVEEKKRTKAGKIIRGAGRGAVVVLSTVGAIAIILTATK